MFDFQKALKNWKNIRKKNDLLIFDYTMKNIKENKKIIKII